ncbi:MAG: PKD domain-containing protein [Gracilimonas sp.]|uniref:PKD domain-containing protein n=1 Tax=Gracilimonas sp. TaxID=1974203 RepID=UPI0019CDC8FD|nr:PKD domain-containing protein [Gracilimonas sp.]MBD3615986.1 PKD domain-containing protein [Gracilimonas sp.]
MKKQFLKTLAILIVWSICVFPVKAQELYLTVAGKQSELVSDHSPEQYDIWIKPGDNAGNAILQIYDAGLGGRADNQTITNSPNTATTFRLYSFDDVYLSTSNTPVKKRTSSSPIKTLTTRNEENYIDQWVDFTDITNRENGFILRVTVDNGEDTNNFKLRLVDGSGRQIKNDSWQVITFDLSIGIFDLPANEALQLKPYQSQNTVQPFEVSGDVNSNAEILDRFGNTYALDKPLIPETVSGTENNWVLSLSGSENRMNNLMIHGGNQPALWIYDATFTAFQKPDLTITQIPTIRCTEKSFELTSQHLNAQALQAAQWQINGRTLGTGISPSLSFVSRGEVTLNVRVPNTLSPFPEFWNVRQDVLINEPPIARLETAKTVIGPNQILTLSAESSYDLGGRKLNYYWFVDGQLEGTEPTFEFSAAREGTHIISVRVNNGGQIPNCSNSQRQIRIQIDNDALSDTSPDKIIVRRIEAPAVSSNATVAFGYTSSGDSTVDASSSYTWVLGDGTTIAGQNITHTYEKTGTYQVALHIDDGKGRNNSIQTKQHTIIINKFPEASFEIPEIVGANNSFIVDGTSSFDEDGVITSYEWFIDGEPAASGPTPSLEIDTPGEHVISLKVRDNSGNEIAQSVASNKVWANHSPVLKWSTSPDIVGPGDEITFNAEGSYDPDGTIERIFWTFQDGTVIEGEEATRSFKESGVHYFTLTGVDNEGVANSEFSVEGTVNVNHTPYIVTESVIRSNSLDIQLDGSRTYDADGDPLNFEWTLPDGSKRSETSFSWKAPEFGVHIFGLKVNDSRGLPNSSAEKTIRVLINRPVKAVVDSLILSCSGQTILFNSSQSYDPDGDPFNVHWDFGDGQTSNRANPSYIYDRPGIYGAKLTMSDGISEKATVTKIPVIIGDSPVAKMNLAGADSTICVDTALDFDGSGSLDPSGALPSLLWEFGDGTVETGPKIRHVFTEPGVYPVSLTVEGSGSINCGNMNQVRSTIRVIEGPKAVYEVPEWIPPGEQVNLDGSSSTAEDDFSMVEWEIQDQGQTITREGLQTSYRFTEPGEYLVTLNLETNSTAACNTATLTKSIRVNAPPVINWELPEKVAAGSDLRLDAMGSLDPDGYIKEYNWYYDGELLSTNSAEMIKAIEPGFHTVTLVLKDNSPTSNNTAREEKTFFANNAPKPKITTSRVRYVGEEIFLTGSPDQDIDGDRVTNQWLINGRPIQGSSFIPKKPKKYYITLLQDDGQGAPNSVDSTIVEITPKDIPKIDPDYPKAIIKGRAITLNELNIPSGWRFSVNNNFTDRWVAQTAGADSLNLYWFLDGKAIYSRKFPITVKEKLGFAQSTTIIEMDWNPVNPSTILDAPEVNRKTSEVKYTWFQNEEIIGYGAQQELPLAQGENRFSIQVEDLRVAHSTPAEAEIIIITE